MSQNIEDEYIIPESNIGILFPSWILNKYKQFKLTNEDQKPKKDKEKKNREIIKYEGRKYQKFISQFIHYNSPHRAILLYHGLGIGKTATTIITYNALYNYNKNWNVYILIKRSLKRNWLDEIDKFISKDDNKNRIANIYFINYDSPFANIQFKKIIKETKNIKKKNLFIIDEVHNFIRNVYSNLKNRRGIRAQEVYEYIQRDLRLNKNTRLICISGTPAINSPYELCLLFNLMKYDLFPGRESDFNSLFIRTIGRKIINPLTKNLFQRRVMGLVSYYFGFTTYLYASKEIIDEKIILTNHHNKVYDFYEKIEEELEKKKKKFSRIMKKTEASDMFKAYTRQACNFVFPYINKVINGENRPRPNQFREKLKEVQKDLQKFERRKTLDTITTKLQKLRMKSIKEYYKECKRFLSELIIYWKQFNTYDRKKGYNLKEEIKKINSVYKGDLDKFIRDSFKKSTLFKSMYESSPKMIRIILNIEKGEGSILFYSNYVRMEGIEIFKIYLDFFGYTEYTDNNSKSGKTYGEYHGGIDDREVREKTRAVFNSYENTDGNIIRIIIISPSGTEGINLKNVRQVHILEPYWNYVRIDQVIGRSIRQGSHNDLPKEKRNVNIYKYFVARESEKPTTDQEIISISDEKYKLIKSFLDSMREVAIDCELFKEHNMITEQYKCFKFDDESQISSELGYGYRKQIDDDKLKENKGSNSVNYETQQIKVKKIKAVLKNKKDEISKKKYYWFDEKTNHVYDYDLYYFIGKVNVDSNSLPEMLTHDTYIISQVIPLKLE